MSAWRARCELPRLLLRLLLLLLVFLHALEDLIFVAQPRGRNEHIARDQPGLNAR